MAKLSDSLKMSLAARAETYHANLDHPEAAAQRDYLVRERGLAIETLQHFKVGVLLGHNVDGLDHDKVGYISLPFVSAYNVVTGIRFRNKPGGFGPRYTAPAKQESGIFNVSEVTKGGDWIVVTEGEVDCMTLWQCGIPAVGIPGANAWKSYFGTVFEGFDNVIITADQDGKGDVQKADGPPTGSAQFVKKVTESVESPVVYRFPDGFDVNSYYLEHGAEGLRAFLNIKD